MTREEEILKAYQEGKSKLGSQEHAFMMGAKWADSHPYWISVDKEMPSRWETNPNVSDTVITYGFIGDTHPIVELNRYHFGDKRWFYSQATHWMPFEHPKKGDEE